MLCMICKQNVPDAAVICPHCGAMPWKMPENFLNPEQHQVWLDTIYTPQLERWERVLRLQHDIEFQRMKNSALQDKICKLEKRIEELEKIPKVENTSNVSQGQTSSISTDDFQIEDGVLQAYNGTQAVVIIPDGVTHIGSQAFSHCLFLKYITIPDGVTSIDSNAFYDCSNLQSITLPDGVTSIGAYAFRLCTSLEAITIPESVTSIGVGAFYSCTSLKSIIIPKSVTFIGYDAFRNCSSLQSVTIPKSVTRIDNRVFLACKNIKIAKVPRALKNTKDCFPKGCRIIPY